MFNFEQPLPRAAPETGLFLPVLCAQERKRTESNVEHFGLFCVCCVLKLSLLKINNLQFSSL